MTTSARPPVARSARRQFAATILILEGFVAFFAGLTAYGLDRSAQALLAALILGGVCVITAGLLRFRWAFALGWGLQPVLIAGGLLATAMYALGAVFAALWVTAIVLGSRIDRERAARATLASAQDE